MQILDQHGQPIRQEQRLGAGSLLPPETSLHPGWYEGLPGDRAPDGYYGQTDSYARRTCNALYAVNGLFHAAVEIAASLLMGDEVSYGVLPDKGLQLVVEEFWAANSFDELLSQRILLDWFLEGELAMVWPTGPQAPPRDLPARIGMLDVESQGFAVEADTRYGATPGDMVSQVCIHPWGSAPLRWERGEFTWGATGGGRRNNPRGRPWAFAAAEASVGYIEMLNLRINAHEMQQRILAVYHAIIDPTGTDARGVADKGVYDWRRKAAGFRTIPREGSVVPVMVRPGYTDVTGQKFDEVREDIQFLQPARGASDAATDMRHVLRLVGLTMGGLPEHWMGEGGNATRTCYSADTETLTIDGWKHYSQITPDTLIAQYNPETGKAEWVEAGPLHIAPYQGDMLHFKSSVVDIMVTPDHRMYGKRARDCKEAEAYEIVRAYDITGNKWQFLNSVPFVDTLEQQEFILPSVPTGNGRAIYPEVRIRMDDWLEFLGYWISEGSANVTSGGNYRVTLAQKKPQHIPKIRRVIEALPEIRFAERIQPDGTHHWVVNDKALCLWLMEHCGVGAKNMRLPSIARHLSRRQSEILFSALMDGDGTWERRRDFPTCGTYYSSSRQLTDDVQLLAMSLGHRANVSWSSLEQTGCYRVQLTLGRNESMITANKNIHSVPYDGLVYCYSVPSGIFITRRNGKIAVQGNTADSMGTPAVRFSRRRQGLIKAYVRRALMTEALRRLGPDAKVSIKKGARKVPLSQVEIPLEFPVIREESLELIIRRVELARKEGIISVQTAQADLGYDPALERERLAAEQADRAEQTPTPAPKQPNTGKGKQ